MAEGEISLAGSGSIALDANCAAATSRYSSAARALDILCVLASAEGAVVTKDELMARGCRRGNNNLQVHISALRRVLYEDWGRERLDRDRPAARLPAPRLTAAGVPLTD